MRAQAKNEAGDAPVTRVEVLDAVRAAFIRGGATRADLIASARTAGARPAVVDVLDGLPAGMELRHVRELWARLPELPVDREVTGVLASEHHRSAARPTPRPGRRERRSAVDATARHGRSAFRSALDGPMRRDDAITRFLHLSARFRRR